MRCRPVIFFLTCAAIAGALLTYLCAQAGLGPAVAARLLSRLGPESLVEVVILLGIYSFLAGERWRIIDRQLVGGDYQIMPRAAYFGWTALGIGFGQILPTPLSLALCRSLGLRLHHRRGFMRGTVETIFEQFFDLVVAGLVGVATVLVITNGGNGTTWICLVLAAFIFGAISYLGARGVLVRLHRPSIVLNGIDSASRVSRILAGLHQTGLLSDAISLRLLALSVMRFVVLALLAAVSARTIAWDCPLWQLAAVQPFAVFSNALPITPGGLGINEWATTSVLFALGIPLTLGAQWAVVNRALVAFAAFCGAIIGMLILVMPLWSSSLMRGAERRGWKST